MRVMFASVPRVARGQFIARKTGRDGELWYIDDWNRCSLEAVGSWEEVSRLVALAGGSVDAGQ